MIGRLPFLSIRRADEICSHLSLRFFEERPSLIVLMFHSLFRDKNELALDLVDPQQRTTVDDFRQLLDYYLSNGYVFVSPDDVLKGLDRAKRHAMISFDDGYYNNHRALPVLEEYRVPAVFCIATHHAAHNKPFWWDVLYRESIKRGKSLKQIYQEGPTLKSWTHDRIDQYLKESFGSDAATPVGDVDRPFTCGELKDFAKKPFVHLGNHTSNHDALPLCSIQGTREEIRAAQETLREITGKEPTLIAYPYGLYSAEVVRVARELGLQLGLTDDPKKNYLPIDLSGDQRFFLGRFCPFAGGNLIGQLELFRSDLMLTYRFQGFRNAFREVVGRDKGKK